jgi:ribosomal protein S14
MFHEIDQDRIDRVRGMDITVVTTATNDDEGRALLGSSVSPSRRTEPWQDRSDQQGQQEAEVQRAGLHPLPAVRPAALGVPQVRPLRICLREMSHRGELPGVHEEQLVIPVTMRRRPAAAGPRGW